MNINVLKIPIKGSKRTFALSKIGALRTVAFTFYFGITLYQDGSIKCTDRMS